MIHRTLWLGLLFLCTSPGTAAEHKVGAASVDITPDYPVRLSGFGFRRAESEGVLQRIWAKALAFADAQQGPAVLITTDNLGVSAAIRAEVARRLGEKAGVRPERLAITATHTHTAPMLTDVAPTLYGEPIPPDQQARIDQYTREFTDKIEQAALLAIERMEPATLEWGIGTADLAVNRRTSGGPVDHDLPVLAVKGADGRLRGIHFSYACHCVTLSHNHISGDWAGFAAEAIEKKHPGAIALPAIGCGADANPVSGVTGDKVNVAADQGEEIASAVEDVLERELVQIDSPLHCLAREIELPFASPRTRGEWEQRAALTNSPPGHERSIGYQALVTLQRLDRGEELPSSLSYLVQTWAFGDELAMIFLPGEVVVDYSLRLKQELDRSRIWVNAYANDSPCYIPSERVLREGGYEGGEAMVYYNQPQKLAPGLEQKILDAVHAQLPDSYRPPRGTEGTVPRSPAQSLKLIRPPPGLEVELIAAEPLIQSPVAIDWDAAGRLWVCEMYDYPSGVDGNWLPGGRIKLLEDRDSNGEFDAATVFLEGIPFPTGVTAYGRGLFVCAAPDLLFAEDTDGDGKADRVEKVFSGFATANYQARLNSLSLGLDNWIHAANGLITGTATGPKGEVDIRGKDFRFDPVTRVLEPVGGLSQQGRARDDWGRWFGCDNTRALLYFPYEEAYFRRNPHIPAPGATVVPLGTMDLRQLFPGSRTLERYNDPDNVNRVTSACSVAIYRDRLLGEKYYGNAFTCEPVHNLVLRRVLSGSGSELRQSRAPEEQDSEFLASKDNWFRPVQVRTGPDGALYVVDMYRFVLEHPRWIPAARLAELDLRAGADRGRIYRLRPREELREVVDFSNLTPAQVAAHLDSPNGTDRDRAHLELRWRKDQAAAGKLREIARASSYTEARVQSLSALATLQALDETTLAAALQDPHEEVRKHAVKLSEPFLRADADSALLAGILELVPLASPALAEQLAFTLGETQHPKAGAALVQLARKWKDERNVRLAVLSSAVPWIEELLAGFTSREMRHLWDDWVLPINQTAAALGKRDLVLEFLKQTLAEHSDASLKGINGLFQILTRDGSAMEDLLKDREDRPLFEEAFQALIGRARELAGNAAAPEQNRREALEFLARSGSEGVLPLLVQIATGSGSTALRATAIASLKRQEQPGTARALLDQWQQASPAIRAEITSILLGRESWSRELLERVRAGQVRAAEIALSERERLLQSPNEAVRTLAHQVFPRPKPRVDVLARYKPSLNGPSDAGRGREVFSKACATCHRLGDEGHAVGPDLATLAAKDAEYWLQNILDPNAAIEPRFVAYEVQLKDGRSLSGVVAGESATSLTILASGGVSETALRSEVEQIRASGLSLMPEGLEEGITPGEMTDLIAFLRARPARRNFPGNKPELIVQAGSGALLLPASAAEIYGEKIEFEQEFKNIGMWFDANEYVLWNVQLDHAGEYDVHFDYACAADSAGNQFELRVGGQSLTGKVEGTGGDWSNYRKVKMGLLRLEPGKHEVILQPKAPLRNALIDLRTVALAPRGSVPPWPLPEERNQPLRNARDVARFVLDESQPRHLRETAVEANPQFATDLIVEMTRDLTDDQPAEYQRIPWIWRVSLLAAKRNDHIELHRMLEVSIPELDAPLRHWQAVVLGGGIINGLSQRGLWPAERIQEMIGTNAALRKRLERSVQLASAMADDANVPSGTRYDALRMLGLDEWSQVGRQIETYLVSENKELQMGAVSAAGDIRDDGAGQALIKHFGMLGGDNRKIALHALARDKNRFEQFLQAAQSGQIPVRGLEPGLREIRNAADQDSRRRIDSVLRAAGFSERD